MKKNLGNLILVIALICSQYNFSQNSTQNKILETRDGETIKLLPNNRVLFEVTEKVKYPDSTNVISISENGKKICGLRIKYVIYQSYGKYELTDSNLILNFIDENPIEKIEIADSKTKSDNTYPIIKIEKNLNTYYDLKVYQKDKELCNILSFGENCEFSLENTKETLIFEYNGNKKSLKLTSNTDLKIRVSINDLKGNNNIKNNKLIFDINELIEK